MTELFQKIINDYRLTSHHVSLYFALLARFLEEGETFEVERKILMSQAKIRTRETYTLCLHQLQEWEYLQYTPAANQYRSSKITFAIQQNLTSKINAVQQNHTGTQSAGQENLTGKINAMQENHASVKFAMQENHAGAFLKIPINQRDSFAVQENLTDTPAPPPTPSSSAYRRSNNISFNNNDDGVGVDGDVVPRARPKNLPGDHPFTQSPYFDWPTFQAAFAEGNRHRNADLRYYYDALCDWRDRASGLPPLRSDWLRTARVFMRNDAKNHKLALITQPQLPKTPSNGYQPPIINNDKYRRSE